MPPPTGSRPLPERPQTADLVRELRARTGLSQRAFGETVGTSGATISAYESGAKEPRLSTLERLAEAAGLKITAKVLTSEEFLRDVSTALPVERSGRADRERRRQRSLALGAAAARAFVADPARGRTVAEGNLRRRRAVVRNNGAAAVLDEWEALLGRGDGAVVEALLDPSEARDELRKMSPFAGLLDDEARARALASVG